jgi:hypothetical protein
VSVNLDADAAIATKAALQKYKAGLQNPLFSTPWAEPRVDGKSPVKTILAQGRAAGN